MRGSFVLTHVKRSGERKRHVLENAAVGEGLHAALSQLLSNAGKMYLEFGLIDDDGYTGISYNDTYSSHAGWTEQGQRAEWDPGTATGGVIASDSPSSMVLTSGLDIKGIAAFEFSNNVLWSTAVLADPISASAGDTINIEYQVTFGP